MSVSGEVLLVDRRGDPASSVVRACLQLKGVGFRRTPATLGWLWRTRRSLPAAEPPILRYAETTIVGAPAIVDWLEVAVPEPALRPPNPIALGHCRLLEQWAGGVLAPAVDGVLWSDPEVAVRAARELGDDMLPGPFAPIVAWWLRWRRARPADGAAARLAAVAELVDAMLAGRSCLLGETLTMADLAVYVQLVRLEATAAGVGEATVAWRRRLDAIDAIRTAVSP